MSEEIELKLELDPAYAGAVAERAFFRNAESRSSNQVSVYFDTPGGKLRKNGYSLRVRSTPAGFVQTLKSLDASAGLFSRGEWEARVEGHEPDVGKLNHTPVSGLRLSRLKPIVRSEVDRTVWELREDGSLIEASLDDGVMLANGRSAPVCEFELELMKGRPETAFRAARRLADHLPVKLGVLSKAERGFALADNALGRVMKASPVPVRRGMNVAGGFAAIAQSCIRHFRLNEPIVLRRRDPEALHQMRVAMRRLRAALSVFRPALEDHQFEQLREELRWFTGQLGGARNLDVYLAQKRLPRDVRKALKAERKLAYDRVVEALQSKRFRVLMIDLAEWVAVGKWRHGERAGRPLADYAARRIGRLWGKVSAHGELEPMHEDERHELRIEVKKLRYALEFVQPLASGVSVREKRFSKAVAALQESLGVLNDLATARAIAVMVGDIRSLERVHSTELQAKCIREAQACLDGLRKIGPYWTRLARVSFKTVRNGHELKAPARARAIVGR